MTRHGMRSAALLCPSTPRPRPHLEISPAMSSGVPHVKGLAYDNLTSLYGAGEPLDVVAEEFGLTRPDVLVGLWFAGMQGTPQERAWLGKWAEASTALMWNGQWGDVQDPPRRGEP